MLKLSHNVFEKMFNNIFLICALLIFIIGIGKNGSRK